MTCVFNQFYFTRYTLKILVWYCRLLIQTPDERLGSQGALEVIFLLQFFYDISYFLSQITSDGWDTTTVILHQCLHFTVFSWFHNKAFFIIGFMHGMCRMKSVTFKENQHFYFLNDTKMHMLNEVPFKSWMDYIK